MANRNVAKTEAALDTAQRARKAIYDGKGGLRTKMKAIKKAVGAQYTRQGTEFAAVKGIKL